MVLLQICQIFPYLEILGQREKRGANILYSATGSCFVTSSLVLVLLLSHSRHTWLQIISIWASESGWHITEWKRSVYSLPEFCCRHYNHNLPRWDTRLLLTTAHHVSPGQTYHRIGQFVITYRLVLKDSCHAPTGTHIRRSDVIKAVLHLSVNVPWQFTVCRTTLHTCEDSYLIILVWFLQMVLGNSTYR